ncbi:MULTISPECIES: hypothetical protein [unclassified Facklamia]|uniref:hypothetical protein n=1 Tax=Aerococcaceae TaxID=186827 RepID=UPI0013BA362C|nr:MULTISPECIES: hypothetical protein [unclassified Facklamia]NEW65265.1 hypothetical protein [Facklamia sp. 252]NEW68755.1 hypothetical protein [Facklamia sp. 253]QQD66143.1 hypothetical protein JDW14_03285 [Aerococcaceae bacterium zg-252]
MEMENKRRHAEMENTLFQAWVTSRLAVAQKSNGKYAYNSFEDFKKIIKTESNQRRNFDELRRLALVQREFKKGGY